MKLSSRSAPLLAAGLLFFQACAAVGHSVRQASKKKEAETRPVDMRQLAVLPIDVALTGGDAGSRGARKTAISRDLQSAIRSALTNRSLGKSPEKSLDVVRIHHAFTASPLYVYREMVGTPAKTRRRLAEGEVRSVAEATGADALLVVHLSATDTSRSAQIAESATAVAGSALMGALTLSPTRVLMSATKVGETSRGSELRIALVDGDSGEILWANWKVVKRPPSAEVVSDLVERAFETFPPAAPAFARAERDAPPGVTRRDAPATSTPAGTSPPGA